MKKLINYILAGILLMAQAACDKQLSAPPKNAKVETNVILDQKTAQIALNGVYYRFANVTSDNITYWRNHHLPSAMYAGYMDYGFGPSADTQNDYVNGSYGSGIWDESYLTINAANGVISGTDAVQDAAFTANRKKEIIAEAKFLRAYSHFKLLSYFAEWYKIESAYGVLIRDELSTLSTISKKRSTVKESYDFIISDLDDAITNGPATNNAYYATKWTAMALKMRVLMSRGATGDYATAITLADNIISNGPFTLEANVKDIFYTKGLSSKEVMLGVKPQANQDIYYYNLSRQYYPSASSLYVATGALKNIFAANDPRQAWVVGPASAYAAYTPNSFYFSKYIQAVAGSIPTLTTETSYAFRLTEVYLLKAEAIIRSGGTLEDARVILRNIMSHGGMTDYTVINNATTADQLLLQSYYETARSLVGEDGQEWMALLRLPFATVQQLKPTINVQTKYILPAPISEHKNNPAFGDQNPGYSW